MWVVSASRNAAPGGGGSQNSVETGFGWPAILTANVSSATCPSSWRTVALRPSWYSTWNAIGPRTKLPHACGRENIRQFRRTSPAFRDGLRPRACSSNSHDHSPSSAAFQTASPCNPVTAFTPCAAGFGSVPANRRSAMHCKVSRAWMPMISSSPREATSASVIFDPSGSSSSGPPRHRQAGPGHQRHLQLAGGLHHLGRLGSVVAQVLVVEHRHHPPALAEHLH